MKAPSLALAIAAAAFAASSLYLWQQLVLERERAAQVEATKNQLLSRLAELDQARAKLMQMRGGNGFISGSFGNASLPPAMPVMSTPAPGAASGEEPASEPGWVVNLPKQSPVMEKAMRWQMRADLRRRYANIGTELGLSPEDARKLIDLLTEQHVSLFGEDLPWQTDPDTARRRLAEKQRADQAAIDEFLGPEKSAALRDYEESQPARQEFEMLMHQLAGTDVNVTPEQSRRLLTAYLEERRRSPMPEMNVNVDPIAYQNAINDWQDDLATRFSRHAQTILDPAQLVAFNEVQEYQREMRRQFSAMSWTIADPSQGVGNRVMATPVTGGAAAVEFFVTPPPPPEEQKR